MAFRNRFAAFAVILLAFTLFAISAVAYTEVAAGARYVVTQCGWHVGQDADWADNSSGRYLRSSYCQAPESADPFEGVHLTSEVRGSAGAVGGTRYSRWRWQAPAGTGIVVVQGQRWQQVKDGFEHRLGSISTAGAFTPFLSLAQSDSVRRSFSSSFSPFARAFESRLLCARGEARQCEAGGTVLAGVRGLNITLDDPAAPSSQMGGSLTGTGWMRGARELTFVNRDVGAGLRYAETLIDGSVRARSEMSCAKVQLTGQWRGTRMQPCPLEAKGSHSVATDGLADGPHQLRHCAIDFAGNQGCSADQAIRVDNNAPAAPRALSVEGGEEWHRSNGFNLAWVEPNQGAASPIASSRFRLTGPGEYLGGPWDRSEAGRISGIQVPGPGEYRVHVWLVDQAGNSDESHSAEATLRLDDVPPTGYFAESPEDDPALIKVPVSDRYSGVADGEISWRAVSGEQWHAIPSRLSASEDPALIARFPDGMPRGEWVLRAVITDRAGNQTTTDRRDNGSRMVIRTPLRDITAIGAGLSADGRRAGGAIEVEFGRRARLEGRLTALRSGGIGDLELTVIEVPSAGARQKITTRKVRTDEQGYFGMWLAPGPGRRVSVKFGGTKKLEGSASAALQLKVRGKLSFSVRPRRLQTGDKVSFRGIVAAGKARHPVGGHLVQIQYFEEAARRWRPVALTRTDRLGRYRTGYRFRYIKGLARIRLRAVLIQTSRFPYSGAASRTVSIRVRG